MRTQDRSTTRRHPRQLSRVEKRFRRDVKRELQKAHGALVRFTTAVASGKLDREPYAALEAQRATLTARYREAHTTYVLIFGEVVS